MNIKNKIIFVDENFRTRISLDDDSFSGKFMYSYLFLFAMKNNLNFIYDKDCVLNYDLICDLFMYTNSALDDVLKVYKNPKKEQFSKLEIIKRGNNSYTLDYPRTSYGRIVMKIKMLNDFIEKKIEKKESLSIYRYHSLTKTSNDIVNFLILNTRKDITIKKVSDTLKVDTQQISKELRILQNQKIITIPQSKMIPFMNRNICLTLKGQLIF